MQTQDRVNEQNQALQSQIEVIRQELDVSKFERESLQARLATLREHLNKSTGEIEDSEAQIATFKVKIAERAIDRKDRQRIKNLIQERDTSISHVPESEAIVSTLEAGNKPRHEGDFLPARTSQQEADDLYYQIHGVGGYREQIEHLKGKLEIYERSGEGDQVGESRMESDEKVAGRDLETQVYAREHTFQVTDIQPQLQGVQAQEQRERSHLDPLQLLAYQEEIGQLRSSRGELLEQFLAQQEEFLNLQEQFVGLQEKSRLETAAYSDSLQRCTDEENKLKNDVYYFATAITQMEAEQNHQAEKYADSISEKDNTIAALESEFGVRPGQQKLGHSQGMLEESTINTMLSPKVKTKLEGQVQDEIQRKDDIIAGLQLELDSVRSKGMGETQDQQADTSEQARLLRLHKDNSSQLDRLREQYQELEAEHKDSLEEVLVLKVNSSETKALNRQLQAQLSDREAELASLQSECQAQRDNNHIAHILPKDIDKQQVQLEQHRKLVLEVQHEREMSEAAARELHELKNQHQDTLNEKRKYMDQYEIVVHALRIERDSHNATAVERDTFKDQYQAVANELEIAQPQLADTKQQCGLCKGEAGTINGFQKRPSTCLISQPVLEMSRSLGDEANRYQPADQNAQNENSGCTNTEQNRPSQKATRSSTRSTRNKCPVYTWPPTQVRGSRIIKKKVYKKGG